MQPWIKGEKFGDSIDKHSLGLLIRLKRTHLGLTQEELAKQLRINRGNLVEIETGKVQPREQTLVRIMTALKPTKTDIRRTPCGAESCPWPEATMSALAEPKPKSNHFQ